MSRIQKFGRRYSQPQQQEELEEAVPAESGAALPSRRKTHPSNKGQMTKWFYRMLVVLFLLLLGGLLLWGRQHALETPAVQ